jgi:S1-C subfamily serine protease
MSRFNSKFQRFYCAVPLVILTLGLTLPAFGKDYLSINSNPSGATVELDGVVVGKTPYQVEVPGGYLHGTKSVFGKLLRGQMRLRLLLDGYLPVQAELARGPMPWVALNGTYHGDFWLLKTSTFNFDLQKAATTFTGNVQTAPVTRASKVELPTEELFRVVNPAVLALAGSEGTGSGFLVTSTGVAVTNAHVARGESVLTATAGNGQSFVAKVVYVDPSLDIALIKLEGADFPFLPVADVGAVRQGTSVLAIGSPSKGFQNSATKGIVSGVGPMPSEPGTWIQTDTAINPGNSGGPLLDTAGQVVGITTMKQFLSGDGRPLQGIGFALSGSDLISVLRRFYPDIQVAKTQESAALGQGKINISASVDGAEVYVDGRFVGGVPATLVLPAGPHHIEVKTANNDAWVRDLDLLNDSNVSLRAAPKP